MKVLFAVNNDDIKKNIKKSCHIKMYTTLMQF